MSCSCANEVFGQIFYKKFPGAVAGRCLKLVPAYFNDCIFADYFF
jgi:hypothetical protein